MSKALLLNASYEPLCLIAPKRAIILLLEEKAEIVHEGTREWRSAYQEWKVPSVLRLIRFVKVPYRKTIPLTRQAVLSRDRFKCGYCGKHADTIDHIMPRSRGGAHSWENLIACCRKCNGKKDDKTLKELNWTLRTQPFAPKGWFWLTIGLVEIDPVWQPYLALS